MADETGKFEASLFKTADKLRKNIDAAEYKNVVLGLIFLKYISDSFQELYERLEADEYSDPEDRDEYIAENCFFVPEQARWKSLQAKAKLPEIGVAIDDAMSAIEKENAELKHVLPKVYAKPNLDKASLGQLIDVISDIELKAQDESSKDLLGRVYEYFLGEFANAEGKKGGQFYTPKSIVKLMVEMIEPYKGRVYDPACGSGGMFVMSEKFVQEHQGNIQDITIYGQESNQTTWKLSKMNLAIRNINSQFVAWNTEGTFLKDMNPDLKADYILANPPFNQSEWGQDILQEDGRWKYGIPPAGNANFGWMQHMLYHLAPKGVMATVLANGSLSSNTSGEGEIRKNIVLADLVDCIVALPKQLFYNTGIPATIWILRRGKEVRRGETLFIDASEMGFMKDRVHREFSDADIHHIVTTYHQWRQHNNATPVGEPLVGAQSVGARDEGQPQGIAPTAVGYEDIKGFCKSATLTDIEKHSFVLTPGRYVGIEDEEDDGIPFEDKMKELTTTLAAQMQKEKELDEQIKTQLAKIGFEL
ncbi:MAG: SAM-dependent DNA methyltransferase [Zetaproteobacteria bacterium]|nr:SAM-dependent DNA methyltransferase [Zetaproteobacteria bacterium]